MSVLSLDHPMILPQTEWNKFWQEFSDSDHNTWQILFERQTAILQQHSAVEFIQGMETLSICNKQIPNFTQLNAILKKETGFSIIPVTGYIPGNLFFNLLANRMFPSTCFIRKPDELDYLSEPDIFHDVFGHVPLLANPIFADFMHEFGKKAVASIDKKMLKMANALYWFTVEFGLMHSPQGLRIYGAGIASSRSESKYAVESKLPVRAKFNMHRVMKTQYMKHINVFQDTYFVIEDFQQLFDAVKALDWDKIEENAWSQFPEIKQGILLNTKEAA